MIDPEERHEPEPRRCPRCGGAIGVGAPGRLCPRCLLRSAIEDEDEGEGGSIGLPTRFAGYELLGKLGEGGMGVVYEARQIGGIRRVVALKRIRGGELADARARRRFLDEARVAAELRHAHIVPIYDVGEHDGEPYFTMDLMRGGTLAAAAPRFAEPQKAAALVEKLARAVHAGHSKRILHRDLKPANILFDAHGEPHIADFGVAKLLDEDGSTDTGAMVGTLHYMAPEQASGHAKRDSVAVDVWSLGVILYELLAGRRPFTAPTPLEVLKAMAEEEPEPLERVRPDIDYDLATICSTCLQKDPERRYISAEALAEDLESYLLGEPVKARRPGRLRRVARFFRRYPLLVAGFGIATLSLVTLTSWALVSAREQERARRDEELAGNVFAARAVAGTVLAQLREYADRVTDAARDPRLSAALARGDDEALQAFCEAMQAGDGDASPITSWFVVDDGGTLLAQAPVPRYGRNYYVSYTFRDYFQGAKALPADMARPVYVSRAYRSMTDGLYKVAIVSPIRGEGGEPLGVFAAAIATDRRLGALELRDERRIAALTVRRDRDPTEDLPNEHILLVHAGVAHGDGVVVESDALRRLTSRRDAAKVPLSERLHLPPPSLVEAQDDYIDSLVDPSADGTRGPWLAGVAPVGHTELAVIVQTRLDDATALDRRPFRVLTAWSVGGAVLLFAGLFAAMRARIGARRASAKSKIVW